MFQKANIEDLQYLYSPVLAEQGLEHGFLGNSFSFYEEGLHESLERFKKIFNVSSLFLPRQVHGNEILDLRNGISSKTEGDALILSTETSTPLAYGIRTADCLPLIIYTSTAVLLVHAGWRGLANGIIEKAVKMVINDNSLKILIGPAAGRQRYEVGTEVLDRIGSSASYENLNNGKAMLSLQDTARNQILSLGVKQESLYVSDVCTISDPEFYSWRHDGAHGGRNLTFVIVR